MQEQIRSLYDLSSLLRCPVAKDKFIRSTTSIPYRDDPKSEAETSIDLLFRPFDWSYVSEKILQCHHQTKLDKDNAAPSEQQTLISSVEGDPWFSERLAAANSRRREQLQYWSNRVGKTAHSVSPDLTQTPRQNLQTATGGPDSATSNSASIYDFSTVPISYIFDLHAGNRAGTFQSCSGYPRIGENE